MRYHPTISKGPEWEILIERIEAFNILHLKRMSKPTPSMIRQIKIELHDLYLSTVEEGKTLSAAHFTDEPLPGKLLTLFGFTQIDDGHQTGMAVYTYEEYTQCHQS